MKKSESLKWKSGELQDTKRKRTNCGSAKQEGQWMDKQKNVSFRKNNSLLKLGELPPFEEGGDRVIFLLEVRCRYVIAMSLPVAVTRSLPRDDVSSKLVLVGHHVAWHV